MDGQNSNQYQQPDIEGQGFAPPASSQSGQVDWKVDRTSSIKRFLTSFAGIAIIIGSLTTLSVIAIFAMPSTRYPLMGLWVKKDIKVKVMDSKSGKPVSDAWVALGEGGTRTDHKGEGIIRDMAAGNYTLKSEKKYYESSDTYNYLVPITRDTTPVELKMRPVGVSVNVTVMNKLNQKPVEFAHIKAGETTGVADENGRATIVLKANDIDVIGDVTVEITAKNYELNRFTYSNENSDNQALNVGMSPSQHIYFLSRYTGNIDVMRAKIDGTGKDTREVILEGTGKESSSDTQLVGTKDWQHLALIAIREGKTPKLYSLKTVDKKLSVVEEKSDKKYEIVGWIGHSLIYKTIESIPGDKDGVVSLKSFDADTGKSTEIDITKVDRSQGDTVLEERLTSVAIMNGRVVYGKYWSGSSLEGKSMALVSVDEKGKSINRIKESPQVVDQSLQLKLESPSRLLVKFGTEYMAYDGDSIVKDDKITEANFANSEVLSYIPSPDGNKVLWHERQGSKYTLRIGDKTGSPTHEIGVGDFRAYAWVTDEYVVLSRNYNELFVLSKDGVFSDLVQPLRTSDYQRPTTPNQNFGVGYGLW